MVEFCGSTTRPPIVPRGSWERAGHTNRKTGRNTRNFEIILGPFLVLEYMRMARACLAPGRQSFCLKRKSCRIGEMPTLPVDVLWIARCHYRPGWSLRLHHHDFWQMILFLDGKGVFTLAGQSFPIRAGELFLIRSGETHGLRAESLVRTLDVKFRVAPGGLARSLRRAPRVLQWSEPSLAARLERIRAEGEQRPPFYRELCSVLLTEMLYLYLRHDPQGAPLE